MVDDAARQTTRMIGPGQKALQRLRQSCRLTLERYTDVASLNAGHLCQLTPLSLDDLGRIKLTILKRREDQAHQVYLEAREALLKYVSEEWSMESVK